MKRTFVVGLALATLLLPVLTVLGTSGERIFVPMGLNGRTGNSYPAPSPRPSTAPQPSATSGPRPPSTATPRPSTPAPSTPVPAPNPTSVPQAPGKCGESMETWHPPVINGCAAGHEHGDAPPSWVTNAGFQARFAHAAATPNENVLKHTSFKGFAVTLKGVELYGVFHQDFHPNGHTARFHSYQIWAKDPSGNVSHWHGWLDYGQGANPLPNVRRTNCNEDDSVRPIMGVSGQGSGCGAVEFESWYSRANGSGAWSWDFGFNNKATYYALAPGATNNTMADYASWTPTGNLNDVRRLEAAWYADRSAQRGRFWATQFGQIVSGPSDPTCGTTVTVGDKTYTQVCLEQYIAPTMVSVTFPGNAIQRTFPVNGVTLPN